MSKGVAYVSLEGYRRAVLNGTVKIQRDKIFRFLVLYSNLKEKKGFTRSEIEKHTGIRINAVCGRVDQLLEDDMAVELPERECSVTTYNAKPVCVPETTKELRDFKAQDFLF